MNGYIANRAALLAAYIIEHGATVRETAKQFGVSKSTVHKDVTERLKYLNFALYTNVKAVLDNNKEERHIRGGNATREKYLRYKNEIFGENRKE